MALELAKPKKILPPGMQVFNETSDTTVLVRWKKMYENPFFYQGLCVTELDLKKVLPFTHGAPSLFVPSGHSPSPHVAIGKIYTNYHRSQAFFHRLNDAYLRSISPVKTSRLAMKETIPDQDVGTKRPLYSEMFDETKLKPPSPVVPDLPKPSRTLYRRPIPPTVTPSSRPTTPPTIDLEAWKSHSFTTVCVDDPMDPNGYYKRNYPLVLMKVPRRTASSSPTNSSRTSSSGASSLYRPMSRTPDISTSFFDSLPWGKIESPTASSVENFVEETDTEGVSSSESTEVELCEGIENLVQ